MDVAKDLASRVTSNAIGRLSGRESVVPVQYAQPRPLVHLRTKQLKVENPLEKHLQSRTHEEGQHKMTEQATNSCHLHHSTPLHARCRFSFIQTASIASAFRPHPTPARCGFNTYI